LAHAGIAKMLDLELALLARGSTKPAATQRTAASCSRQPEEFSAVSFTGLPDRRWTNGTSSSAISSPDQFIGRAVPTHRGEAFCRRRVAAAFTFFAACSIKFSKLVYLGFMPVDCRLALSFGDYGGEHGQESEEGKEGEEGEEGSKKEVTGG